MNKILVLPFTLILPLFASDQDFFASLADDSNFRRVLSFDKDDVEDLDNRFQDYQNQSKTRLLGHQEKKDTLISLENDSKSLLTETLNIGYTRITNSSWTTEHMHIHEIIKAIFLISIINGFALPINVCNYIRSIPSLKTNIFMMPTLDNTSIFEKIIKAPMIPPEIKEDIKELLQSFSNRSLQDMFYLDFYEKLSFLYKMKKIMMTDIINIHKDPIKKSILDELKNSLHTIEQKKPSVIMLRQTLQENFTFLKKEYDILNLEIKSFSAFNVDAKIIEMFNNELKNIAAKIEAVNKTLQEIFSKHYHLGNETCPVTKQPPINYCNYIQIKNSATKISDFMATYNRMKLSRARELIQNSIQEEARQTLRLRLSIPEMELPSFGAREIPADEDDNGYTTDSERDIET